ncbi:MAG: metallophosphoesterase [bacterium]|nr:metallophosphoesterase [bacterium]
MKFLHTADWQLGMTRHFLADEAQSRFDGARIDVIRSIGALAVDEGCSFVVVCGDVFESNQVSRQVILRALDAIGAAPQVAFYLLPGNHDPLDASSVYSSPTFTEHKPDNVVVLESSSPVEAVSGVELIPAPWFTKRPLKDLVADACDGLEEGDAMRIVVGHGAIDERSPDKSNPALISLSSLEEKIDKRQIHYVALGDRHSTTDEGRTGRVWYSGAPEPTDYVEINPGNALLVELDEDQVHVQERSIGDWRFLSDERELTSEEDLDNLEEWLNGLDSKERTIVKLALIGQVSLAQKARLDELLDHHSDVLAALEAWERRSELVVVPDDTDLDKLELSGFAREAVDDLSELAESGEQAVTAREALALLHRLAGANS